MATRPRIVAGVAAGCSVLVAGVLVAVAGGGGDSSPSPGGPDSTAGVPRARAAPGSHARFTHLAAQRSNVCGLQAEQMMHQRSGGALQGSCCSPMDEHAYREQIRALRAFPEVREIPRDPYDVPIRLARRLLRLDAAISLTRTQRATYRRAMRTSDQKGPCCCPCWRWDAFRGLSKFLIARRGWPPTRLAELIDALEGCGGPAEHGQS